MNNYLIRTLERSDFIGKYSFKAESLDKALEMVRSGTVACNFSMPCEEAELIRISHVDENYQRVDFKDYQAKPSREQRLNDLACKLIDIINLSFEESAADIIDLLMEVAPIAEELTGRDRKSVV